MDGSGKLELTGNLGDVMKESAHAALSYIRANCAKLGIASDFYKTKDIHVHFPERAVPKDGPSAGVTVCTAMVSALTGVSVRRDVAMTGEISLRGRVLRIGGLKEKTMAALRNGIKTVISMNPIMIDGTGMCGGCRVVVGGETKFACVDGPDFDGHLVDFDSAMRRQPMYRDQEQESLRLHRCNMEEMGI